MLDPLDALAFAKALSSDEGIQRPLSVSGLVRKTDDPKVIAFTLDTGTCHDWVKIPIDLIEKVFVLGKRTCRDHVHDFVTIQFKLPTNPETKVFAALLRSRETIDPLSARSPDVQSMAGTWAALPDCVVVRIYSFVSGNLIHSERVTQPDLAKKVQNVLKSWSAKPYGPNWSEISNC